MASRPFEGIKILDFTWTATGPHTLNPLAFYGATIIKVESRARYDALRSLGPFKDGIPEPEHSYAFAYNDYLQTAAEDGPWATKPTTRRASRSCSTR